MGEYGRRVTIDELKEEDWTIYSSIFALCLHVKSSTLRFVVRDGGVDLYIEEFKKEKLCRCGNYHVHFR